MGIIIALLLNSLAVFVTAYILPGIHLKDYWTALVVAVVLGVINTFIRPIILILTLPINILTLGLFTFVILGGLVLLVSSIVPGFVVDGFWWALAFALVLSLINSFIHSITYRF
ncbi:phage holin family protein [Estrella lausannensis]|uniref:Conserved putative membrane protein n=1 Tax=Estrella lausannensis TaxID=483423 RepID=A0A0H5E527_9BACT|nr:phage holin family protein [Estrella lausannensis]CRX38345.1 Conserved putative membrane protein [Estrella lausannensis]